MQAYQTFLLDPQPRKRWIGTNKPRWHPEWRPFTRLPSPSPPRSRDHILTVIDTLFDWWFRQGYIVGNPWRAGPKRSRVERPQFAERSLSLAAWNALREYVIALGPGERRERLQALLALLYSTGLRRAEVAAATVQPRSIRLRPTMSTPIARCGRKWRGRWRSGRNCERREVFDMKTSRPWLCYRSLRRALEPRKRSPCFSPMKSWRPGRSVGISPRKAHRLWRSYCTAGGALREPSPPQVDCDRVAAKRAHA